MIHIYGFNVYRSKLQSILMDVLRSESVHILNRVLLCKCCITMQIFLLLQICKSHSLDPTSSLETINMLNKLVLSKIQHKLGYIYGVF